MSYNSVYETIPAWSVLTMICATTVVIYEGDLWFATSLAIVSTIGACINRLMDHNLNQEVVETLTAHYIVQEQRMSDE